MSREDGVNLFRRRCQLRSVTALVPSRRPDYGNATLAGDGHYQTSRPTSSGNSDIHVSDRVSLHTSRLLVNNGTSSHEY